MIINAYPILVLSNEELICSQYDHNSWYHVMWNLTNAFKVMSHRIGNQTMVTFHRDSHLNQGSSSLHKNPVLYLQRSSSANLFALLDIRN